MTEGGTFPDDPAALAASGPESGDADGRVYAVGIGPGNPEYLTPRGARAIREADVVVGFETVVEFVRDEVEGDALACGYRDEAETLARFADRVAAGERGTAVLMGDPNHSGYQFVGKVESAVDAPVEVIPGISSLQVAASQARTPLEETTFVTLHKSGPIEADLRQLERDAGDRHLLVLPRPYDWMPERVAHRLLESGAPDCEALVLERLTHDDESVTRTSLESLAAEVDGEARNASNSASGEQSEPRAWKEETAFSDLSVLAVRR